MFSFTTLDKPDGVKPLYTNFNKINRYIEDNNESNYDDKHMKSDLIQIIQTLTQQRCILH